MKARLFALAVLLLPATLQADPPDRVARLSYVSGTVSFRAADLDDQPSHDVRGAREADDWDDWCAERDRREERGVSRRYVGTEVTGYEDLDSYGRWHDEPDYGPVWTPTEVDSDWAPYRSGHWS